jgi:hypothetical protein
VPSLPFKPSFRSFFIAVAAVRAFLEKLLHYLSSQLTSFSATKCANAAALDPWPNTVKALRSVVQETTHR